PAALKMKSPAERPHAKLYEGLGWAAALAAGVLVLLPSTLELLRARDAETAALARAEIAEAASDRAVRELLWLENDPAADEKLREAEAAAARRKETSHD
ncbi:MAG: hypothetical protein O3A20_10650, partial [Planctomycetota bacterium]|nr:hypothetical protein [Planctomycetota bacterium]